MRSCQKLPPAVRGWALLTLVAGCTNAPPATSTAAPTPVAATSAHAPPAAVTVATAPDLAEYIGKTCAGKVTGRSNPDQNIDDYVNVDGRIYVRHRHGPTNAAENQLHGADTLHPVVKGWSGWPYEFDSDSGAREFLKPAGDPQHMLMNITDIWTTPGTYDCQSSSAATMAATAQLASNVTK